MKQRIFRILSILSLAMCVVWFIAGTLSFFNPGYLVLTREDFRDAKWTEHTSNLYIGHGALQFRYELSTALEADVDWGKFPENQTRWHFDRGVLPPSNGYIVLSDDIDHAHGALGFYVGQGSGKIHGAWRTGWQYEFIVPDAAVCVVFAILPAIGWARRKHAHAAGLCPQCSYDLRATPERCPECGKKANA